MRKTYRDPRWKTVRLAVLERDGWRCQLRRSKCKGRATEVDHILPVSDGGAPFDPTNLRAACKSCNIGQRNERLAALAREARGLPPKPAGEWDHLMHDGIPLRGHPDYVPSYFDRPEFRDRFPNG